MSSQSFKSNPIILSLLTGTLLTLSWPAIGGQTWMIFFAFVPMLFMEETLFQNQENSHSKRIFFITFLGFLLWNIGTTYFILYIREPGLPPNEELISKIVAGGLTYLLNSCFMAIAFWLFHLTRRKVGSTAGYSGLLFYWMSFEYLHMHWSINWPWLNLGNVFADDHWLIQWYEITGSPGGTLWVLLVNLFLFWIIRNFKLPNKPKLKRLAISLALLVIIPVSWSYSTYSNYQEQGEPVEVVCVQPNVDPYEEKFSIDPLTQLRRMYALADSADSDETKFYVLPETAFQESAIVFEGKNGRPQFRGLWHHNYENTESVKLSQKFLDGKDAAIVAGAADREYYTEKPNLSAREIEAFGIYYDSYNSTLLITEDGVAEDYRKSKLVPGVESIPFVSILSFLDDLALDLGGASGSLGTQEEREVFTFDGHSLSPTICYESIFGEFNTEFMQLGSEAIFISTNDSWWQDSPGYRQLLSYAKLRAIETRKGIARSANTGITCFINQRGDITSSVPWWTETALRGTVHFNDIQTFYSQNGDYLSRLAAFLAVLLLLWTIVKPIRDRIHK